MKVAIFNSKRASKEDLDLITGTLMRNGVTVCLIQRHQDLSSDTDYVIAVGGDGTFLAASGIVGSLEIPVIGVNSGRLGFLSENRAQNVCDALLSGKFKIENRTVLETEVSDRLYHAVNDIVLRTQGNMMSINIEIDGIALPTYWADGLVVSTSAGSTAYSLSAGGPIVLPDSKVLIITPVCPHNLNVRPLIVPRAAKISVTCNAREPFIGFHADNLSCGIKTGTKIDISLAPYSLRRICLDGSNFIGALVSKLHWGEDSRNEN